MRGAATARGRGPHRRRLSGRRTPRTYLPQRDAQAPNLRISEAASPRVAYLHVAHSYRQRNGIAVFRQMDHQDGAATIFVRHCPKIWVLHIEWRVGFILVGTAHRECPCSRVGDGSIQIR
jgi:hypothetical protein